MESVARITRNTKTLIDNVYYNKSVNNIILYYFCINTNYSEQIFRNYKFQTVNGTV